MLCKSLPIYLYHDKKTNTEELIHNTGNCGQFPKL